MKRVAKIYDDIDERMTAWIERQPLFFVATAPLRGDGHVNVSPKGVRDSFHVESKTRVWYEDLSGSGACPDSSPCNLLTSSCWTSYI